MSLRFVWIILIWMGLVLLLEYLFLELSYQEPQPQLGGIVVVSDGLDTDLRVIMDERRGVACYFFVGSSDIDCVPTSQMW